jgi:23S rRNA (guanosine2251-2'-O)-methyltransferase
MIIEGKNPVKEAILSDITVEKLMINKANNDSITNSIIETAREKNIRINFVDKFLIDKLSPTGKHQGVICFTTEYKYFTIDDILENAKTNNRPPFIIILDEIEDPHNLGSIIRSAECGGADGIIIQERRAVSVNDTVIKISEGAAMHIKVAKVTNINDAIKKLKDEFINVYAADMDGELVYNVRLNESVAIVIGGEGKGVKRLTKSLCDKVISVPQKGKINSLNASNAAAVMIYEVVRQRLNK